MKRLGLLFLAVAIVVVIPMSQAETPGRHPHYLQARSDLRTVQWLMRVHEEPNVMRHLRLVDQETDRAIREIDRAGVIDKKNMQERGHVDVNMDRPGRFQKAMELLVQARRDISTVEDNRHAVGWRDLASRHIDVAMTELRNAARELHMDHLEGF